MLKDANNTASFNIIFWLPWVNLATVELCILFLIYHSSSYQMQTPRMQPPRLQLTHDLLKNYVTN